MSEKDVTTVAAVALSGNDDASVSLTDFGQVTISTCCDTVNDLTGSELDDLIDLLTRARAIRKAAL